MEGNKGYRGGNDLFVCFPSRMVTKSSHSPARIDRFKESVGSCRRKGGHSSPMFMFPVLSRRRTNAGRGGGGGGGGGSEVAAAPEEEPTSPKVTCIGQVRVKSKKGNDKKWGHMPDFRKDVCGAFKGLGSDFSCFLPCSGDNAQRSSGFREGRGKQQSSACMSTLLGKVLMVVQDGDDRHSENLEDDPDARGQGRPVDSARLEDPYGKKQERTKRSPRRFEDDDSDDEWMPIRFGQHGVERNRGYNNYSADGLEEEHICVPPRNALLLMRCRSEPLKLSLDSELWMAPKADEPHNKKACVQPQKKACVGESYRKDSSEGRLISSRDQDETSNDEDGSERMMTTTAATTVVEGSGGSAKKSLAKDLFSMQCEPELTKLSLEISKETWVSGREFFRSPMESQEGSRKSGMSQDGSRRLSKDSTSTDQEEGSKDETSKFLEERFIPPEGFILPRCKSEPLKVSVKLAPEACLWKRRNFGKPLHIRI